MQQSNKIKSHWLVNAQSGSGFGHRLLKHLTGRKIACQAIDFSCLDQILNKIDTGCVLVIAGGDGTISSVLARVAALNSKPRVAIFPLGTGNDLARALGVGRSVSLEDLDLYLAELSQAEFKNLQLWNVSWQGGERKFCNYFSIGFDGHVILGFDRWRHNNAQSSAFKNRLVYLIEAAKAIAIFMQLNRLVVHADCKRIPLPFRRTRAMIFSNIAPVAGFGKINRLSSPFDARLEGVVARSLINYVALFLPRAFSRLLPSYLTAAQHWVIEGLEAPVYAQADGEGFMIENADKLEIRSFATVNVAIFSA